MAGLLPPWPLLSAFLVASLVLAVTPGPAVFYIVTRSATQGRRVGLASAMGIAAGNLVNMLAASLGLVALFAVSSLAFTAVKYVGALYLGYLGVRALYGVEPEPSRIVPRVPSLAGVFRDGAIVAVFNPKTTLFFAAFLPQFLSAAAEPMIQSVVLGTLFVSLAAITDGAYALAAGGLAPTLAKVRGVRVVGRYATASALIGLGVFAAVAGSRDGR
jgi:threonine/homoserine/homoserine lactone efflux protein